MFICDECLKDNFENEPGFRGSHGLCELCKKAALCNDIPSKYLARKTLELGKVTGPGKAK